MIAWLEGWRQKKFIGRRRDGDYYTLLDGLPGVGKSCLLNPIVHWARYTRGRRRERVEGEAKGMREGETKMLNYTKVIGVASGVRA